jgi:hypothetical protein
MSPLEKQTLARTFHKYARALAGALFSQEIFLSWPDPLVRHSLGKFPEKTKSCAIIAAIHELFGLNKDMMKEYSLNNI